MSKLVYIRFKNKIPEFLEKKLYTLSEKLVPDNINGNPPKISIDKQIAFAIINPVDCVMVQKNSVLLGHIFANDTNWSKPLHRISDGSYALYRSDEEITEIVSDPVGSRTVWHYQNSEFFIASSSQKAIVLFLENFEFNDEVIPWVLSTGSLGPIASWDKRIKRLAPDSSIVLRNENWVIETKNNPIDFKEIKRNKTDHLRDLRHAIKSTFQNLNIDLDKWILPLSGGYDSRGILFFLLKKGVDKDMIKTITWGLKNSRKEKGNDAHIAEQIADKTKVKNRYYTTNPSGEPIDIILKRFIELGEGRTDHISGYMDGFKIWKILFEDNISGVIRGDEGFGWSSVSSPVLVRFYTGCALCTDFENLKDLHNYGISDQELPDHLKQRPKESLSTWRDRLYHQYRIPTILAALSDLKLGYVEQISPLLSRKILNSIRSLPDTLRTEKLLFKIILNSMKPKMEYAKRGATVNPEEILKSKEVVSFLKEGLQSRDAKQIFRADFLKRILKGVKTEEVGNSKKTKLNPAINYLKKITPRSIKNRILMKKGLTVDPNVLAFRVFIIIYMHNHLNQRLSMG